MVYKTNSPEETRKIAKELITGIFDLSGQDRRAIVVGLYGDLGAGKTTLAQCIAEELGVSETVTSPTFVIEKIYRLVASSQYPVTRFENLIHIDAYRIENSEELKHLGWQEITSDPKNLILIEWPERVAEIMPGHIKVNLKHISENSREVEVVW